MDLEIRAITPEETEGFIRATSMAFGQTARARSIPDQGRKQKEIRWGTA